MTSWRKRTRSAAAPTSSSPVREKRRKVHGDFQRKDATSPPPSNQSALLLHATRQPYEPTTDHTIPEVKHEWELLVKVQAIGLNPIDWKAPDFGFGVPVLPYVAGREFAGTVVKVGSAVASRIQLGDLVTVPSTDYRDLRKAAYQQYSIASSFNTIRLPKNISVESGSILGVAFVSAVLALGICMGLDFSSIEDGPNLLNIVKNIDSEKLPTDIRQECLKGIGGVERAKKGDFLVIWGGSSTCAHLAKQIARLAGLKIVSVVDSARHGLRLSSTKSIRPDLVVDSHDPERAIEIVRASTSERARFGFDTQGKDTAAHLLRALAVPSPNAPAFPKDSKAFERAGAKLPTPPSTPLEVPSQTHWSHLVGLTGLPKTDLPDGVVLHSVPIKLFHEVPEVGEALSAWCEKLLLKGLLVPPDVVGTVDGLEGINDGLDRMRRREIRGGRLVAVLD
ncbi:GroES-like protein [Ophiobolus disseminans]|uniref:GroES-like protein n=1 Tax=Ophiobolus disseminans TaxID=1469910 RepID=A0A6A7A0L0_9PLEO|nr:GroES-like protein [Ophiobolus disseminans]